MIDGKKGLAGVGMLVDSNSTTDYEELTNKPKINNVELQGNKTSEELNLITAGVNIDVNNGFISSIASPIKTVESLPTSGISDTATYLVPNNLIFPSVSNMIGGTTGYNYVCVEKDNVTGTIICSRFYNEYNNWETAASGVRSVKYERYTLSGDTWVLTDEEQTNTQWVNKIVFANIIFSNTTFNNNTGGKRYDISNNQTDINGVLLNGQPVFTFKTYQHRNNQWNNLEITDLTEILEPIYEKLNNE